MNCVEYSPSDWLAVSGYWPDNRIKIYDEVNSASPQYILDNAKGRIHRLAYNRSGSRLAVGGEENVVWVYNGTDPASPLFVLAGVTEWIQDLTYSPDDSWLVVGGEEVLFYNGIEPSSPVYTLTIASPGIASRVFYNSDGSQLNVVHGSSISIYKIMPGLNIQSR